MHGTGEGHPDADDSIPVEKLAKLGLIRIRLHRRDSISCTERPVRNADASSSRDIFGRNTPIPKMALKGRALSVKTM
jgi:hypothetical protein